jgi:putative transposase
MKIFRAYKTELDPNNKQKTLLRKHTGAARWAYNWGLNRKIESYEATGKSPSAWDLHKELVILKNKSAENGGVPWMYEISKSAPQQALHFLDFAYKSFFRRCREDVREKGFPKFKARKDGAGSFTVEAITLKAGESWIQLPKIGKIRLKESSYLPVKGKNDKDIKITGVTVSEKVGRWFISMRVEVDIEIPTGATPDSTVGVDVGVKNLAVTSDGEVFKNPESLRVLDKRIRLLQKSVSRKTKHSKNWQKAVFELAKLYHRIACIRKDSIHKATAAITKQATVVVIEDLNLLAMVKMRPLAKCVSDSGMGECLRQLAYKMHWQGKKLIKANRFYPSSKRCHRCGAKNNALTLDDRIFLCPSCGLSAGRDLNAAINLKLWPQVSAASARCPGSSGRSPRSTKLLVGREPNAINSGSRIDG